MAEKLGPRVTVVVGKGKGGKTIHSFMLKRTADYYGFESLKLATKKNRLGRQVSFRGSQGAGSIMVPTSRTKKTKTGVITLYKAVPMPNGMNVPKIQEFLKKAKKNKPKHFRTVDGRTYPVDAK
ncbi:hypothetical protein [Gloeocapsopsis dulcis]|uniref:Uncharacterized protein n=1 Tax=Gloeocapsopsis dulcis AAB1 = 1H9 TaxID=1433147 RepID=A0A6N8G1V1_9CHRO|nr:hypothetical protein [Gloeocapsopsis dulcis]MUL39313.1 hypothetical protein [Gloeocapsopsis dulcis AAB1 = 1H9]WNN91559.1 hypothetical protein P0S91_10995 [Gloeocapsopsis dulcis]